MAITPALLTSGSDSTNNPSTPASITPTANRPVYAFVAIAIDSAPFSGSSALTVSGNSLTWSEIGVVAYGSRRKLFLWRGVAASPTSGSPSVNFDHGSGGGAWTESAWAFVDFTELDSTTPNGTIYTNSGSSATSGSVTVSDVPDAGDIVVMGFCHTSASSNMTINGELDTELTEFGGGTDWRRMLIAYDTAPDSTPAPGASWSGNEDWGAVAFVLNKAAGGGSTTRGRPFGMAGTAFNGGRTFQGIIS